MKNSCLISIEKGDKVLFEDRDIHYTVVDFKLSPNGVNSPGLVCLVFCEDEQGNRLQATSKKFRAIPDAEYAELYPTSHLLNIP